MDDAQLKAVRDECRAAAVRAAYCAGLRGGTLPEGATEEQRKAFGVGKERRSLGRERPNG